MEVPYYGVFVNEPSCYHCGHEAPFPEDPKVHFPLCKKCGEKGLKFQERPKRAKNTPKTMIRKKFEIPLYVKLTNPVKIVSLFNIVV